MVGRTRFLVIKNFIFLVSISILILIIYLFAIERYIQSILLLIILFISMYFGGKKVAPLFLEKRTLKYLQLSGGIVENNKLYKALNYGEEDMSLMLERLKAKSYIEIDDRNNIKITSKGKLQLNIWGN